MLLHRLSVYSFIDLRWLEGWFLGSVLGALDGVSALKRIVCGHNEDLDLFWSSNVPMILLQLAL